jgi:predicted RNA-binding protein
MADCTNAAIVKEHNIWNVPALSFIKNKIMWLGSIRGSLRTIHEEDYQRIVTGGV